LSNAAILGHRRPVPKAGIPLIHGLMAARRLIARFPVLARGNWWRSTRASCLQVVRKPLFEAARVMDGLFALRVDLPDVVPSGVCQLVVALARRPFAQVLGIVDDVNDQIARTVLDQATARSDRPKGEYEQKVSLPHRSGSLRETYRGAY